MDNEIKIKAHFMLHVQGMNLFQIAEELMIHPKLVGVYIAEAERAKLKFESREPVVYRKRLVNKAPKKAVVKPKRTKAADIKLDPKMTDEQLQAFLKAALEKGWGTK